MSDQANETIIAAARRAEIRQRINDLSPAPWSAFDQNDGDAAPLWSVADDAFLSEDADEAFMAQVLFGGREHAEFIAASRDDVPWLLDQLAAKDAEIAELRDLHEASRNLHANAERLLAVARADTAEKIIGMVMAHYGLPGHICGVLTEGGTPGLLPEITEKATGGIVPLGQTYIVGEDRPALPDDIGPND